MTASIRFGVLGASRIAPKALIEPARRSDSDVEVTRVASRDYVRAAIFGKEHGVQVASNYDAVINDPDIDAVYIGLPHAMHAGWAMKALRAGKHVLVEKPFAVDAEQATRVMKVAAQSGHVCMDAMHWRYHPLATKLITIARDIDVRRLDITVHFPIYNLRDIRWSQELVGGALMDAGIYAASITRTLTGELEFAMGKTRARWLRGVERRVVTNVFCPRTGVDIHIDCSILARERVKVHAEGTKGWFEVENLLHPSEGYTLEWLGGSTNSYLKLSEDGGPSTYDFQLDAFVDAVLFDKPFPTTTVNGLHDLYLIDDIRRKAGITV